LKNIKKWVGEKTNLKKKGLYWVFTESLEFRVELTVDLFTPGQLNEKFININHFLHLVVVNLQMVIGYSTPVYLVISNSLNFCKMIISSTKHILDALIES